MSTQGVLHLSDASFLQTIKDANMPVFIDFFADWCGPCQMLAPFIDELATKYQGKVLVTKMNIDENRQTPSEYGVMSIPTVMVLKFVDDKIQVLAKQIGFSGKEGLEQLIEQSLIKKDA